MGANLIDMEYGTLMLTLLPRATGKFGRRGLSVNKLRYRHDDYTEQFLQGGTATVAYNPDDVSAVWLIEDGHYIRFELVESRFSGKDLSAVQSMKSEQRMLERTSANANIQAQIDLALHIEAIANGVHRHNNANLRDIRSTRRKEQNRAHVNFMEGGTTNENI